MAMRPPRFVRRLLAVFTWHARDRDMDQEMAFHVEALAREYMRDGMSPDDAARAASRRFGSVTRLKEQGHDLRGAPFIEGLARDVRHMGRGLRRSPGFAFTVILTLALGIGGNTAIFSVVDQLLLRPLPYPDGDRLVVLRETMGAASVEHNSVSPANWLDWQRQSRMLGGLAAWRGATYTLTGVGEPARINGQVVSAEFFPVLGVAPLVGRTVSEQDDRPNSPLVAVLSHETWQQRFGGDPNAVGRVVQLSDRPVRIIGVMPAGFRFVDPDVDVWAAFRLDRSERFRETGGRFMNVIARVKPEATIAGVRAEMDGIARELAATYAYNKNTSVRVVPLRDELTGQVQRSLLVLYAAVGVLLSIACFNVANLLLARAAARRREIAIRTSLGAGRSAIVRQLLAESLLLAAGGGALGILLARWSLDALVAFAPPDMLRVATLSVDRRVLLYATAMSILTGVVVGVVPAVLASRRSIVSSLRAGGSGIAHSPRIRQALVVCQVAMTVILLCGAGLLARTVVALHRADSGVDKHGLLTMEVALPPTRYDEARRTLFYRRAVAALRELPGATAAGAGNSLAVVGSPRGGTVFHRLGTPERPLHERPIVTIRVVTPGYFQTLGIPVLRGREFADTDDASAGFVVNEAFVRAYLPEADPLQQQLSVWMEEKNPHLPILGVVGDVSEGSIRDKAVPTIFYSHLRLPETAMTLFVRSASAETLARPSVSALHAIDPNLAITRVRTFEGALSASLARERLNALVSGAFAASGLVLSSLGLYGLLAFLVAERTKEIGIRIALGARLGRLAGSVVGGGLRLVAIGAVIGVAGALALLRSFGPLLFGVTPYDASTYAAVLVLLCAVAAVASFVPARRAARVQPLIALRQE